MARILVAEDDELIGEMIKLNLEMESYTVDWVKNGAAALQAAQNSLYDLIILDVMLPEKTGFEVATALHAASNKTPVLMLTALSETTAKVKGLDAGADDYLTKPFDLHEFFARVRALLRRKTSG